MALCGVDCFSDAVILVPPTSVMMGLFGKLWKIMSYKSIMSSVDVQITKPKIYIAVINR